jgi:hypothetical protein
MRWILTDVQINQSMYQSLHIDQEQVTSKIIHQDLIFVIFIVHAAFL